MLDGTPEPDDFSIDCAGPDLLFLCFGIPLFIIIIILIESPIFSCFEGCCEPK